MAVASFSRWMHPATLQRLFRNDLRNMKSSRFDLAPTLSYHIPQICLIVHLWNVLDKQVRSREGPSYRMLRIHCKYVGGRYRSTSSEVLWSPCLDGPELFGWQRGPTLYKAGVFFWLFWHAARKHFVPLAQSSSKLTRTSACM